MFVHDAPVYLFNKFLWVGDVVAQSVHHILVDIRIGVRLVVAQTNVATLHDAVEF